MSTPFKYCPNCQSADHSFDGVKRFYCNSCGFEYYHNTASAVAAFLEYEGKILAVERNREPGKGMLDLPGGFSDPYESGEESLLRELQEELNISPLNIQYLCSFPNKYSYKNISYYTADYFFTGQLVHDNFKVDGEEIKRFHFFHPEELDPDEFCFESMKKAIDFFKRHKKNG